MTKTVVQLVTINETGDSYYRMRWPARDLALQQPSWRVINAEASARERLEWAEHADLLVLYQSMDLDLLPVISRRRESGRKTLVEYNDNFYEPQPWSPVAKEWSSPRLWFTYETFMRESDGVIVTGEGLYNLFSNRFDKPVYILQNYLPEAPESFEDLQKKKTPYLSLGWAGSLGHIADLFSIAPTIRELLNHVPGMKFHVMGNESIPQHLGIPADRLEFIQWGTMHEYFQFWEKIHIGIAPLLPTAYNECRSDIKAVEMSSRGVLALLQDAVPYRHFLKDVGIKSFTGFSSFKDLFLSYASKRERIAEDAKRCHAYAAGRVGIDSRSRAELYSKMMEGSDDGGFPWPVKAGYHELKGTPHPQLISAAITQEAQRYVEKKDVDSALKLISTLREDNPLNPDSWLIELRLLRRSDLKKFQARLKEASDKFPHDVRFLLLTIEASLDPAKKRSQWERLLTEIENQDTRVRHTSASDVIPFAVATLPNSPQLCDIGDRLLEMYPGAATLRFALASLYEKEGHYQKSLEHFEFLIQSKLSSELGGKFLETTERGYMEAWKATLRARLTDGGQ